MGATDYYYYPADYYAQAANVAKNFCRSHKEADKETAHIAAQEAAEMYERSERLRRNWKFEKFCYLRIQTKIYQRRQSMDNELKNAIIRDYQAGMTAKEIAERYQLNPKVTRNNLARWAGKGLLELRKGTDKPVHTPKKEKAPESAATETSAHEKSTAKSIAPHAEKVNPSPLMKSLEVFAAKNAEAFEALYGECEIISAGVKKRGGTVVRLDLEVCGARFGVEIKAEAEND